MKRRIGQRKVGVALFCVIAVVAFTGLTGVALAADPAAAVTGELTFGPLQVDSVTAITLGTFALTGRAGIMTASGDSGTAVVTDATGSGAGYQVQAVRTAFTYSYGTAPVITRTLDGAMSWAAAVVSKVDTGSSTDPTPAAQTIGTTTPVNIAVAAADAGMGSYNLTFGAPSHKITMGITAHDYVGSYTGTVTVSTSSGPGA